MHRHMCTRTSMCAHACTYTRTHTHTHTCTRAHTHTQFFFCMGMYFHLAAKLEHMPAWHKCMHMLAHLPGRPHTRMARSKNDYCTDGSGFQASTSIRMCLWLPTSPHLRHSACPVAARSRLSSTQTSRRAFQPAIRSWHRLRSLQMKTKAKIHGAGVP